MAQPRLIALEGLPFTGKSTAAAALRRACVASVVDDYHELLTPADRAQIATLSDSAPDQRRRVELYRDIDDLRWKQAEAMTTPVVVFDRCFVSIAAYRLALHHAFGETLWRGSDPNEFGHTDCDKPVPAEVLYFAVDIDAAVDRHARLATTIDTRMREELFLTQLVHAYQEVLDVCGADVVTIDSNQPLSRVVATVCEYIHGTPA